ncbi:MAG: hypothetical protein QM589_11320 [Thermomicrobiales bacterium]
MANDEAWMLDALRRIFRRDDTIDLDRDALDLEETRRFGLRDKRSAYDAIARIKAEQQRLRRLRKMLEKRAERVSPQDVRHALRGGGGQFAEMALSRTMQPSDTKAMYETQLQAIEVRQKAVDDLWVELELFARS